MKQKTTVAILIETREELKKIGIFGETWDDIIRRLVEEHKANLRKG